MENKSNSINVGQQRRLTLYCDKRTGQWLAGFPLIFSALTLSSKKSASDLILTENNSRLTLSRKNGQCLTFKIDQLLYTIDSLSFLAKSTTVKPSSLCSHYFNSALKLFKSCSSLSDLILTLSSGKFIKGFDNCQILLHEKSKNKLFDQSDLLAEQIKVMGLFLAKEIDLKTHTAIIILSRGDFFSPSDEEKEYFDRLISVSQSELKEIILRSQILEKETKLKDLVNHFPLYFKLTQNNVEIESLIEKPPQTAKKKIQDAMIEIDASTEDFSDPDYFHHERLVLMGELLNTLRHELSNPLFGINISTSLLLTDSHEKDSDMTQTITDIASSSKRCQMIIENFADLYGDRNILQDVSVSKLIEETLTLTKSESRLYKKHIEFVGGCDDLFIHTNPTLLSQIIFNLVINSAQALRSLDSKCDKIIKVRVEKLEHDLLITISDTGPGIPKHLQEKVFDAFYTTKDAGTGLGLAICTSLAKKLNGSVKYIDIALGASFELKIPQRPL